MGVKQSEAIAEGVAIALAAARLAVKNQILVETISSGAMFEPDHFDAVAIGALHALAAEELEAAVRAKRDRKVAWGRYSQSSGTHDYRDRDVKNLRRRERQYSGVAKRLTAMTENPHQVRKIVDTARELAWSDVASNLDRRLAVEAMRPEADPDYDRMREARMQALMMVDLQQLESQVKARRDAAAENAE